MKKFVIIIFCICTIMCVFESCKGGSSKKAWKAVVELFKKPKPSVKSPVNMAGMIETARIDRIKKGDFNSITEVAEHFKLQSS
jgi:hypothetical protein